MKPLKPVVPELPRMTFEDVMENQIRLVDKIGELIGKDRILNLDERQEFKEIYYRSTLGLGASASPKFEPDDDVDVSMTLDELVFNYLSSPKPIEFFLDGYEEHREVKPCVLWTAVLKSLQKDVLGDALHEAIKISPERAGGVVHAGTQPEE